MKINKKGVKDTDKISIDDASSKQTDQNKDKHNYSRDYVS